MKKEADRAARSEQAELIHFMEKFRQEGGTSRAAVPVVSGKPVFRLKVVLMNSMQCVHSVFTDASMVPQETLKCPRLRSSHAVETRHLKAVVRQ